MEIYVEASEGEEEGAFAYKKLTEDIITDLSLGRVIESVRIHFDVKKMLFYIEVRENPVVERIEVKDIVELTGKGTMIEMEITNEIYAPYLLDMLWETFGKENVNQIQRNILEIKSAKKEDIFRLPLSDIKEKEKDALIQDMILRIIPIGLRIVREMPTKDKIKRYLASENPITEEAIEEVEKITSKPAKALGITEEEVIKRKERKKMFVPYKESYT